MPLPLSPSPTLAGIGYFLGGLTATVIYIVSLALLFTLVG
jgi:hypothetical protein